MIQAKRCGRLAPNKFKFSCPSTSTAIAAFSADGWLNGLMSSPPSPHAATRVQCDHRRHRQSAFRAPAYVNSTIVLVGQLTYVGRTSMEVRVDTFVEELNGKKTMINRAYLVMVALDENEQPTPVPGLICETDEERAEWEAGQRRKALRKQREKEMY